jgi:hypothetical protein
MKDQNIKEKRVVDTTQTADANRDPITGAPGAHPVGSRVGWPARARRKLLTLRLKTLIGGRTMFPSHGQNGPTATMTINRHSGVVTKAIPGIAERARRTTTWNRNSGRTGSARAENPAWIGNAQNLPAAQPGTASNARYLVMRMAMADRRVFPA